MINANLNFNFYGIINCPFSAIITKENKTFNQPSFKQFGLSPSYKFLTVHAGYRNMQFSPYSLSGLTFLGGGIDINPSKSKFKFSAMYGRFSKAIPINYATSAVTQDPSYERWGYGGKITYKNHKQSIDLILFKAFDDKNSLPDTVSQTGITPQENLVLGLATRNNITDKLAINIDYTLSAYNSDIRQPETTLKNYKFANHLGPLFTPHNCSSFNKVIGINLNYQATRFSIGFDYRRIDPEYKSMGTTYLSNDSEDFTGQLSTCLFNSKLSLSGSFGYQHNNLDNNLESSNRRIIGSLNSTIVYSEALNFSVTYSNYSSKAEPTLQLMQDSIKFIQVTENIGFASNYNIGDENIKHGLSFYLNYQIANTLNQTATELIEDGTKISNTNVSYRLNLVKINMSGNVSLNYTDCKYASSSSKTIGPTFGFTKKFFDKKIQANLSYSVNKSLTPLSESLMNTLRFNVNFRYKEHHSCQFNNNLYFRNNNDIESNKTQKMQEYRSSLTYSYNF